MKTTTKAWYDLLNDTEREELRAWLLDPDVTYKSVAEMYGRPHHDISNYANRIGVPPRHVHKAPKRLSAAPARPTTLSTVERELEAEQARLDEARRKVEELKAKRAELQLRFEWDGSEVLVFGITDGAPVRALASEWLQFLNMEGARKLREFIAARRSN
jgi:hypothetical protein